MDPENEYAMCPGPKNPEVLHLQADHRSSLILEVGGGDVQRARRRNPTPNKSPNLHKSMIPILTDLRFDGVARLSYIHVDWSLITALIERWRPETHTFHLPIGECTITLEDVSVLLGLRIDGDAVTGSSTYNEVWRSLIEQVFGVDPGTRLNGGRLQLSWLTTTFDSLPDDPTDEQLTRYTQSYLLQLIAGVLFTDHSGGQIHCMYIPLVMDFKRCQTLAWGAAVLAYLFRELCKSCRRGTEEIAGCILLLQLWAWTRLHTLAPVPRGPSLPTSDIWGDLPGPYGMRWCTQLSFSDTSSHVVSTYRLFLDILAPSHFIWQPYTDQILESLPVQCIEGSHIWSYTGPLICFHIVEPHQPERCMRQFGMTQTIPSAVEYSIALHKIDLKGKPNTDWRYMHREYILHWDNRVQHIHVSDFGTDVVDGYDQWYADITRRYHTRIGGARLYMLDLLHHISSIARGEILGDMEDIDRIATYGRQVIEDQFSHGVCHDFPVEDRREKEIMLRPKPKRVGHKGGRGGINAPRKLPLDDESLEGNALNDERDEIHDSSVPIQVGEAELHQGQTENVDSFRSALPQADDEAEVNFTPPLSHPTFNLLTQSPPVDPPLETELLKEQQQEPAVQLQEKNIVEQQQHRVLRPRKHKAPTCGTGGHKITQQYKRLRLKNPCSGLN